MIDVDPEYDKDFIEAFASWCTKNDLTNDYTSPHAEAFYEGFMEGYSCGFTDGRG